MLGIKPKIGEVYLIDFPQDGHTQGGIRPGVIFQNDVGNKYSPNVVVLPLTTSIKRYLSLRMCILAARILVLGMTAWYCVKTQYLFLKIESPKNLQNSVHII